MKKNEVLQKIIYILALLIALALSLGVWLIGGDISTVLICGSGTFLLLLMIVLMDMLHRFYTDKLLLELSNLMDSIIDMRKGTVFSDVEDTLLSKLQSQVIKLSGILTSQNKAIKTEKDEIKSLISDISHQIKTPVASIKMFGDLLQDSDLSEEKRREYLKVLEQSLDKLIFLTDSMIKMSRLESGVIQLRPQATDLSDIVLHAVKQVYPKAKEKDIDISFDTEVVITLMLDRNWTAEAIFNILDNAVKYSSSGGAISISIIKYESFARLDILDNGIGIAEEEQSKIFKRFYRGKDTADVEGVGIGLYLSRKIITDEGGYIKVKSDEKGSKFSVFLPIF